MRRAALWTVGALACTPPELAGSSDTGEVASSTTGAPVTPTGALDDTSTGLAPDTDSSAATTEIATASGSESGDETAEPPTCAPSDVPGGALRWSLAGAQLPGQATQVAVHLAGGVALAGAIEPGTEHGDAFVEVRDAAGAPRWTDRYAGVHGLEDSVLGLAVDAAGFVHALVRERVRHEVGQGVETVDERLVVLRYAPDGAHVWRWERAREPAPDGAMYLVDGSIAVVGDTVFVLAIGYAPVPTALINLDAAGNLLSEITPEGTFDEWRGVGPHGLYFLRDQGAGEVGRVGLDGALKWTAPAPGYMSESFGFLGPDGELHVAWDEGPGSMYLRHHTVDGAVGPELPIGPGEADRHVTGGAVRCDGTLLLVGSVDPGGADEASWLGRYTLAAEPLWVTDLHLGPPSAYHGDRQIVAMPDGDALVLATYMEFDPPWARLSWIGRFAGG